MRHLLLVCTLLLLSLPAAAQDTDTDDFTTNVTKAVQFIPGMDEDVTVRLETLLLDDDETDVLSVVYLTREVDPFGYRAETLDVFRAVAATIAAAEDAPPVDLVTLLPSVEIDGDASEIELVIAQADDVTALAAGEITRTTFLSALEISAGEHQLQPTESPEF
jgi:hypothetical protein